MLLATSGRTAKLAAVTAVGVDSHSLRSAPVTALVVSMVWKRFGSQGDASKQKGEQRPLHCTTSAISSRHNDAV
eukprot:3571624-Amphidinium_carterae.1